MSFLFVVFITALLLFLFSCLVALRASNGIHLFSGVIIGLVLVATVLVILIMGTKP